VSATPSETDPSEEEPFAIGGRTVVAAVIGDPVRHSLSPVLHNAAYRAIGFDGLFVAFAVRQGAAAKALTGARELGMIGLSVTTPHKDAIAAAADQVTDTVALVGSANCIAVASGVTIAHSTDGEGLLDDLAVNASFDPAGQRCAVLGAGGAARAIVLALTRAGAASVTVVNRTSARAQIAAGLAGAVGRIGELAEIADASLVVNATSLGLSEGQNSAGIALAAPLGRGQLVVDLVYAPSMTPFLTAAAERGASVRNGLGMLVHQAARQVAIHIGESPPIDVMWQAVADDRTRWLAPPA
jgi:shikimate dehydrogenase